MIKYNLIFYYSGVFAFDKDRLLANFGKNWEVWGEEMIKPSQARSGPSAKEEK